MTEIMTNCHKVKHCKCIYNGKLYDTETAKIIGKLSNRIIFKTNNSNYFLAEENAGMVTIIENGCYVTRPEIEYFNISPMDENQLKNYLGQYDIGEYIRIFGEPEEA